MLNPRWWREEDSDRAGQDVVDVVTQLRDRDASRLTALEAWGCFYGDERFDDYESLGIDRDRKSRLPVLTGMVESVHARISRAKPIPTVLTTDGNWTLKNRAKQKTKWLAGMFDKLGIHELASEALKDALVYGDGYAKVSTENDEINVELVWAGDLFVEAREARHRKVRSLYQTAVVDRDALLDEYPDYADEIERAASYTDDRHQDEVEGSTDMVLVVEAWRLPVSKDRPGRHVIAIDGCTLLDEPWTRKRFPFARLPWATIPRKYWAQGMVERGAALQSMINKCARTQEENYGLSFPAWFVSAGSKFNAEQMSNIPWLVYTYEGTPPTPVAPLSDNPDRAGYIAGLKANLFETQGVSELAAQSQKPAGLNSGKALVVFQDIESERFLTQGRAFENFHITIAELLIEEAEDLVKEDRTDALRVLGGKKMLEAIEYKDVRFGDEPWQVRVFPVTSLSASPSGRLEQVSELLGLGLVEDVDDARELLDFPDLDKFNSIASAGRDLVEKTIELCLQGKERPANPYMPLGYALKRASLELDRAEIDGAPEEGLEMLRTFISHVETLMAPPEPPPPPPMPEPGPPMPGPPMPDAGMDPSMMDPATMGGMDPAMGMPM